MSEGLLSVFLGPLFLICFFLISLFVVIGVKCVLLYLKSKFYAPKKVSPTQEKKRKPRSPVRSIEINPDETTKIVFKKSS